MKVVVYNLGCKVNQYESFSIVSMLQELGHEVSYKLEWADVYIINTCAVTTQAEQKSRQSVTRCLKYNKDAKILICGCASEANSDQFLKKSNVIYVSGVANKNEVINYLTTSSLKVIKDKLPREYEHITLPSLEKTRAYLKVQDGCNRFCSYCIIPYLRGRSRSRDIQDIINEVDNLERQTHEIVINGIDLSSYGMDTETSLPDLFRRINHTNLRVRLGSLEISCITQDFIDAYKSIKNHCNHFHLSLQSGSNKVLADMNRRYTVEIFLEKMNLLRKNFEDVSITTDLICGYPTETEQDFQDTLAFINKANFSEMHIFGYSNRAKTKASRLKQLDAKTIKDRVDRAITIASMLKENFLKANLKKSLQVLFESKDDDGYYVGYSKNYIKVYSRNGECDTIKTVKTKKILKDGLCDE